MNRRLRILASIASIAGGTILAIPAAAAGEESSTASQSAALRCKATHPTHYRIGVNCWRGGGESRGWMGWDGATGRELFIVDNTRADHRKVTGHVIWWQDGIRHHQQVTDPHPGIHEAMIRPGVPDGSWVNVYMCLEGVGCGEWYRGRA